MTLAEELIRSTREGNINAIKDLLKQGADVNEAVTSSETNMGSTALITAASNGRTDVMKVLLEAGADPNLITSGVSALNEAAARNQKEAVEFLLANKADIEITNKVGFTPLIWCAQMNNPEIGLCLLQHGANAAAITNNGTTARQMAKEKGHAPFIAMLDEFEEARAIAERKQAEFEEARALVQQKQATLRHQAPKFKLS